MALEFGPRLNVLTGDNGLGKSFVLDLLWWVLAGDWAGAKAIPSGDQPRLDYAGAGEQGTATFQATFQFQRQLWSWQSARGRGPRGSVIYVGAEHLAAFVMGRNRFPAAFGEDKDTGDPLAFVFEGRELWDGKVDEEGRPVCNGLIRDWVNWMRSRPVGPVDEGRAQPLVPFELLERVLAVLSPDDAHPFKAAAPRRVTIEDSREIPTLRTPWDAEPVPVTLASAGVRRVLELAYALVWTWHEHIQAAELRKVSRQKELFILIDEPETHLHPRWQRTILPAVLELAKILDPSLELQLFVTTHSPIVLASLETIVREQSDRLFHFDVDDSGVEVRRLPWVKHGDAVGWLGSEAIDLRGGGRSVEAVRAIRWADAFMLGKLDEIEEPAMRDKDALESELRRVLAGDDEYWTYWLVPRGDVAQ